MTATLLGFLVGFTAGLAVAYWMRRAAVAERDLARLERNQARADLDQMLRRNVRVFPSKWTPGDTA